MPHLDTVVAVEASILLHVNVRTVQVDPRLQHVAEVLRSELGQPWKSDVLRTVHFFSDLPARTLHRLAPLFRAETVPKHTTLVVEGDIGAEMFVLVHGSTSVTAWSAETSSDVLLTHITADSENTYFGEMSLMSREPRTATVRTDDECFLLVLEEAEFPTFLQVLPDFADRVKVIKELQARQSALALQETASAATTGDRQADRVLRVLGPAGKSAAEEAPATDVPTAAAPPAQPAGAPLQEQPLLAWADSLYSAPTQRMCQIRRFDGSMCGERAAPLRESAPPEPLSFGPEKARAASRWPECPSPRGRAVTPVASPRSRAASAQSSVRTTGRNALVVTAGIGFTGLSQTGARNVWPPTS